MANRHSPAVLVISKETVDSSRGYCFIMCGIAINWLNRIDVQGYSNRSIHFQKIYFFNYYWTYGDVLYTIEWRENSQSYFHTSQAVDVSLTCDAADVKSIINFFPHSSQNFTGNGSHGLSDAPLQIIDIRILRDFLSICTQDMDLASVVFVKQLFESVCFFLNSPVYVYKINI
jgi:hypothetical protein